MKYFIILLVMIIVIAGCSSNQSRHNPSEAQPKVVYPVTPAKSKEQTAAEQKKLKRWKRPKPKKQKKPKPKRLKRKKQKKAQEMVKAIEAKHQGSQPEKQAVKPAEKIQKQLPEVVMDSTPPAKTSAMKKTITPPREKKAKTDPKKVKGKSEYYLRIVSLAHHEYYQKKAEGIVAHLKKEGFANTKMRSASGPGEKKYWVVDIGPYKSIKDPEVDKLKGKIRDIKYEGVRQFKDPYFLKY